MVTAIDNGTVGSSRTCPTAQRVLPLTLASQWAHHSLPAWVVECCGLPRNATVGHLGAATLPSDSAARAAVEFFIVELVKGHSKEIAELRVFPLGFSVDRDALIRLGCSTRAINALGQVGLFNTPKQLSGVTYKQLFAIRGLGVKSVLNIALCSETLTTTVTKPLVSDPKQERGIDVAPVASTLQPPTEQHHTAELEIVRASLKQLAESSWAENIFGTDPRFRDLIPANGDSLATHADAILGRLGFPGTLEPEQLPLPYMLPMASGNISAVSPWLTAVQDRVDYIESLSLEDVLSQYLEACSGLKGERLAAMLARFGWSGNAPTTLEDAGQMLNVTRERIRQIEKKVRDRLPLPPVFAPALSKAVEALGNAAPIEVKKASALLREKGLTRKNFSPESILAAATDLRLDLPISIKVAKGFQMVTRAASSANMPMIVMMGRKRSGASGVVSAVDVASRISLTTRVECTAEEVVETLRASGQFRHLFGPWFWASDLPGGRNRLVNICRKMLSVTSLISIARLRDGVRREYTFRNLTGSGRFNLRVPPSEVMRAFLSDHPEFVVDGDIVRSASPLDYRRELGESDRVLVDVLRSSPSAVLDRATIVSECMRRGVSGQTINTDLSYSCVVEHVDVNIWALRGADINPSAIEAVRKANALRPKETRVRDFGWTRNGQLWIAGVAPPLTQASVFGCPAGARKFIAGQKFVASTSDGTPCGTVGVTSDGVAYGFGAFQRLSEWDPGDIVMIEFDLEASTATLFLGSEELLDTDGQSAVEHSLQR